MLLGKVFQVGGVQGGGGVANDFFHAAQAAFAGFGGAGSLESGLFFAVGLVVGQGTFFPVPLGGLLAGGAGGATVTVCPKAKGSCEGAGRAQGEVGVEVVVPFGWFIGLRLSGFGRGSIGHVRNIEHMFEFFKRDLVRSR